MKNKMAKNGDISSVKSENPESGFYGAMKEIGRAIDKRELADKAWDISMRAISDKRSEKYARRFLDGKYGQAFALKILSSFPKGASPSLITNSQLKESVKEAIESWKRWPRR